MASQRRLASHPSSRARSALLDPVHLRVGGREPEHGAQRLRDDPAVVVTSRVSQFC